MVVCSPGALVVVVIGEQLVVCSRDATVSQFQWGKVQHGSAVPSAAAACLSPFVKYLELVHELPDRRVFLPDKLGKEVLRGPWRERWGSWVNLLASE